MAGPELTIDTTGNPRVEVFFDPEDLDEDAATLRMFRFSEGRTWLVRGGVDVQVGIAALDWEVPFNTEVAYRAEQFDSAGVSLGFTDVSTTTVAYTGTIVHEILAPSNWGTVKILRASGDSLTRETLGETLTVEDGLAVHVGTGRRGLIDVPVSLLTDTLEDANLFQQILGPYEARGMATVCIRSSDRIRWPRTFFAAGEWSEVARNVQTGGEVIEFTSSLTEVRPPFPGVAAPFLTYADMQAAYSTYAEAEAAYATYVEAQRDYSLAGLAG